MKTADPSPDIGSRLPQSKLNNRRAIKLMQVVSWVVTVVFVAALAVAIYRAVVLGNPLPIWAWLGVVALLAAAIGLVMAYVAYRSVAARPALADADTPGGVKGQLRSETWNVEADGAKSLLATLKLTQGVLRLMDGATNIAETGFTYDDGDWKQPVVDYAVDEAGQGVLTVTQKPASQTLMRQGHCEWFVRLNPAYPTELDVQMGAGRAELRLARLNLSFVHVQSGVGELVLDLQGDWQRSTEVVVQTGIGDTVLRLPETTGVRIRSAVGLGSTNIHGLERDGDVYTNALFGQTPAMLDIVVEGGVGKVSVE